MPTWDYAILTVSESLHGLGEGRTPAVPELGKDPSR